MYNFEWTLPLKLTSFYKHTIYTGDQNRDLFQKQNYIFEKLNIFMLFTASTVKWKADVNFFKSLVYLFKKIDSS